MKYCPKCKNTLPLTSFGSHKGRSDGKQAYCLQCTADVTRQYYSSNSSKRNKRTKLSRYKLTEEQYNQMRIAQNNKCAICQKETELQIDHDRSCCPAKNSQVTCGKCVRGLLCFQCNTALGKFQDNPEYLQQAIRYLASERK